MPDLPPSADQHLPSEIRYYPNASGEAATLVRDPGKYTVRFGTGRVPLSAEARALLRERSAPVTRVPHYGIIVYESDSSDDQHGAVMLLNREKDIDLAAPVLHRSADSAQDIYLTRHFVVQFWPEVSRARIDELNADHGVQIVEPLDYAENGFLLRAPAGVGGLGAVNLANLYRETGLTCFSHPDLISKRHKRSAVTEPAPVRAATRESSYVSRQWHLTAAQVVKAWSITRGVRGVRVAILDDGVDVAHPEFGDKVGPQFDFTAHTATGTPQFASDNHGTACAGVATAKGLRMNGAAPGCTLIPVRFPAVLGDADEAKMFKWAADNQASVISASWGPQDMTGNSDPLPGSTQTAIHYCVAVARNGKGIPVLWAAGNGDESVDLDGYAANPEVMAIAASNDREQRSWYSDHGNAIFLCAPSSGDANAGEKAILTTDRSGPDGYNGGAETVDADYTDSFGGTSAAAPLVAGIVGLMLSANPGLGEQEVRTILADTAAKIGAGYDANTHRSPEYGHGQVDAYRAVRAAQAAAHGVTQAPRQPSIIGPATADRENDPPQFEIDPGGGNAIFYAVEVAASAQLLDGVDHTQDPSFYASWQDSPFLASNPYQLPDAVWERLRGADRLYYRAWFSSSGTQWRDTVVTTEDANFADAPSMELTGGEAAAMRTADHRPARRAEVQSHAGFDRLHYPGDEVMQALYRRTNLAWTGFYLAPAPSQGYTGWMSKASVLREMGWGLAPIFVGQQWPGGPAPHDLSTEHGTRDAATAVTLADRAGIGEGAVIYLDVEVGGRLPALLLDYCDAWFAGIRASSYRPGVYCYHADAPDQLRADNPDLFFWVYRIGRFAPTQVLDENGRFRTLPVDQSGCDFAVAWQYLQEAPSIPVPQQDGSTHPLEGVDLDCATVLDPSFPERSGSASGGTGDVSRAPSITGPARTARSAPAPQFEVDPGSGPQACYAVEVATAPQLFGPEHDAERGADTFYASWRDNPFLASNPYQLPDPVWERLRQADALFYRAWFSSSDSSWTDTYVTTPDADALSAPSVSIVADDRDERTRSVPPVRQHPEISAPPTFWRGDTGPRFQFVLPPGVRSYRIEVATEAGLFDAASANRRTVSTWYAAPVLAANAARAFGLPVDAWEALRGAARLYYRINTAPVTPIEPWSVQDSSTPDEIAERAPWIELADAPEADGGPGRLGRDAAVSPTKVLDADEFNWRRRPRPDLP
jgi:subtilisin family serine protease